ncbi:MULTISPECIES: hypothetical protein [Rhizobium]|uniref:Uncharacterized protein n=1 Tax=Rhizobium rhododendri TaxID=2506430 RepID=A0ABY8IUL5_9HYPH|nr:MULTISPECIES: hypothetical protein [Rhizobium]TQX81258.1 hypothetical protein EQW76_28575 [Rhizobium sp. rho-13.1]TQY04957.1 hypothetical protein EQW74_27885 [Rhizobium sp. rho-1.1]WFS26404.1 hypothetical protein PR018_25730 [Rhizobium rhododendri]
MQIKFAVNWERLKEKLKENKEARKAAKRIKSSHIADFSGEGQDLADHFNEQKTAWPIARWIALGLESNHDGARKRHNDFKDSPRLSCHWRS